jgi:hypothetical protein
MEHGDRAGHRAGVADVDGVDRAVGDARSDERHVQHSGLDQIVDVLAFTGQQRRILEPNHWIAQDRARTSHVVHPLVKCPTSTLRRPHYDDEGTRSN